ncbi:tetratricopeptide repeat protein [Streptomyces sp. 35G-GA-8]|uniref:tetratricopeptide repeat protein n=1 Tax=Streptomyces sp. 35G-GA-8 TaxID=2939434 RepID=UPI00201EB92E|nr:tetratricopeptide repeat protein [Streptomyces sp. 35G-GA-8]MCL7377782.1 trypsin-like peptidase domain-containing protein [Streptomyces sp. 35G-GA-8]
MLLSGGLVLTCAHVVLSERRPGSAGAPRPLERVYAEFPGARSAVPEPLRAEVLAEYLRPPTSHFSADIALLRLAGRPRVKPAVLHRQIPARNALVHTVGYPVDLPGGEHINARLMGRGGPGHDPEWVQLDPESAPYAVRHGFSGSGVVHSGTGGVIGILVDQHGTERFPVALGHAYVIPTETILRHLPTDKLDLLVSGPRAVSRTIPLAPGTGSVERALGLRRTMTRWLSDGGPVTGTGTAGTGTAGTAGTAGTDTGAAPGTDSGAAGGAGAGSRTSTPGAGAAASLDVAAVPDRVAEPVELAFAHDGDHDALFAIHSTLILADRERNPRAVRTGGPMDPQAGSIDIALDATGWTAEQLVARTAARAGLRDRTSPPAGTAVLLERIAEECPPLSAAFLSVDRVAPEGVAALPLLRALLKPGHSRLLLVFRDPHSPLLERVAGELLDPGWAERRAAAVAGRLAVLAALEKRRRQLQRTRTERWAVRAPESPASQLAARLAELRQGDVLRNSAVVAYELFRLTTEVEDAVQSLDLPHTPRGYVVLPPGDGLTDLPHVTVGNPDDFVEPEPELDHEPEHGEEFGARPRPPRPPVAAAGPGPGPGPGSGSGSDPGLVRGQELHQQYRVVGRLGQGSYGQVYLARDQMLEERAVALKGVRDPDDPSATKTALTERLRLVSLNHPSIIKVFNYARHPGHPANTAKFIVMEFADGAPLAWVAEQIAQRVAPFHDYRVHEFIAVYGLRILNAFTYLHVEREFVYGDLSLTNVIHCGDGIKLIDVAGVRKIGSPGPVTYPAPELRTSTNMTVSADLYAVGAVLQALLDRVPEDPSGLGTTSLRRALSRAMAPRPEERFATAEEMSVQLRGVLRELRSLRIGEETFEPSPLFAAAPAALDGELGKAPPLEQWRHGGNGKRRLTAWPPRPTEVALGLPVPKPDDADENWTELQRTSYDDPAGLLQLSSAWDESPERALLRCRLHLEIARDHPAEAVRERAAAERELTRARVAVGALAAHDWRLHWHQGLLHLARDRVESALECFDLVYAAIPGEYAPKLALGYCHEVLGRPKEAMVLYGAVWHRNHALGGAAFGLARIHLADRKPRLALDCLEAVPADSRHRTAARTAMVRILADPPVDGSPPTVASARQAWVALHRLTLKEGLTDRHAQERLRADLQELLLLLVTTARGSEQSRTVRGRGRQGRGGKAQDAAEAESGPLATLHAELAELPETIPAPVTARELREQLAACYLRLSEQVPLTARPEDRELAEALVDNAYRTRPYAFSHRRGEPSRGLFRGWLRGRPSGPAGATTTGERR